MFPLRKLIASDLASVFLAIVALGGASLPSMASSASPTVACECDHLEPASPAPPPMRPGAARLCAMAEDAFANVTVPEKPTATPEGFISNAPIQDPCSSAFELLYREGLYAAAHVLRLGLGRSSTMLFDPLSAITILAPSELAFSRVNISEDSAPDASWRRIAESHVLPGPTTSRDIACSKRNGSYSLDVQTWNTRDLTMIIDSDASLARIDYGGDSPSSARVLRPDIPACLSILHVLDRVILP